MNGQDKSEMIQQRMELGRTLHSQAIGDFLFHGAAWLRRHIFGDTLQRTHSSKMKRDLKFS